MALQYSNINNSWEYKKSHMNLDNFATFMWRGAQSFQQYHMFIISGKDELKFYNGPSFSNEYTTPQFQSSSGNITGVKFNRQTLSFKVGIYWFTAEDYQQILSWLDAYIIDYLNFDFNPNYGYLVKLTGRSDSQRTILGYNDQNKLVYYTEMTLTWELQGPAGARSRLERTFDANNVNTWTIDGVSQLTDPRARLFDNHSDSTFLESPLLYSVTLPLRLPSAEYATLSGAEQVTITMTALKYYPVISGVTGSDYQLIDGNNNTIINSNQRVIQQELFNITLQNLPWQESIEQESYNDIYLHLTYDSEAGILYYNFGNSPRKLLTLLTTVNEGANLVKTLNIFKYMLSGQDRDWDKQGDCFIIQMWCNNSNIQIRWEDASLITYARTNVI